MQFTLRLTISEGDDMVFNEYYEALFDVEFDSSLQNEHAYSVNPVISIFPALDSELNEIPGEPEVVMLEIPLFFEDSYIDWENWDWLGDIPYVQIIDEFGNYIGDNPFNESLGFSGLVDNRSYQVDMLQYELETLDTTLFNIEWSIDANTDNWLMYNAEANLNSNLASFYYALDDWTNYTVHDDLRIHFEGLEQAAINNVNENQTLRETEKANRAEVAQHHTDAEKELSDANKVYDKIEEKYEGENTELLNEISKLEGLILETEDITKDFELSNSMKDGLLDQSDAYKRNLIDPETADFYSEDERRDYVIETHAASVSAYSASVGYQEQAEETRLKTNELASAIMFISTATVLCGIVSATLKKDNRGNRMMVLALIGVAVVLFGLGATRFLMT
ncbi:MAG: hypothetical protein QF440_05100, partial [Candidatus Thalassarchaeaceae archaeon]|nr:hypothetical protein [Candidatus Thalassarchaeaceae archaeon]